MKWFLLISLSLIRVRNYFKSLMGGVIVMGEVGLNLIKLEGFYDIIDYEYVLIVIIIF